MRGTLPTIHLSDLCSLFATSFASFHALIDNSNLISNANDIP